MVSDRLRIATEPEKMSPEQRAVLEELEPYYAAVKERFGLKFVDELWERHLQLEELGVEEAFTRGFRLGGQLALELCREA